MFYYSFILSYIKTNSLIWFKYTIESIWTRDVHRGGKSTADAPPSVKELDTATLPHRGVMKSEIHRAAAAPHWTKFYRCRAAPRQWKQKSYRCRAATATILKYSLESFSSANKKMYVIRCAWSIMPKIFIR